MGRSGEIFLVIAGQLDLMVICALTLSDICCTVCEWEMLYCLRQRAMSTTGYAYASKDTLSNNHVSFVIVPMGFCSPLLS